MTNGSLLNKNGDIFFVTNTVATIDLENVTITNQDADGYFLRAAAAGWGSEGSNGGQATMNLVKQTAEGDIIVDETSSLNLYLKDCSSYTGAINSDNEDGQIYVEIQDGSTWTLSGDSYITSLTCASGSINLNGHKLYVNGVEYSEGTASTGEAIVVEVSTSSHGGMSEGNMPGGDHGAGGDNEPPEKPDGDHKPGDGNEPPAKPGSNS